jgi:uncharacterized YkwD family protein
MVKIILLAILLLVSGCSTANNNAAEKTPSMKAHTAAPAPVTTQASSTATATPSGSVTIKQAPTGFPSYIWDLIQTPAGNQPNETPSGTPSYQTPTGYPTEQTPANPAPSNPTYQAPSPPAGQAQPSPAYQTPAAPAGQAQQGSAEATQFAQQVLDLVNQERAKAGVGALTMSAELSNMAMVKAQDMYNNNYFDHNSPTHGSPFDMMKAFGITYNTAGENIAKGQSSPSQVMNDWMNSPGHRANILNSSFTSIGIAYYNSEWVQEFTG